MIVNEFDFIHKIDSINLELVLSAHDAVRSEEQNDADRIVCFCPFCRRPSTPHFVIFKMIFGGLYGGQKWFCPKTKTCGYGAISLQAALMGCSTTGYDLLRVCRELCRIAKWGDFPELSMRPIETEVAPQEEVSYNFKVDFTPEALFALGCRVTPSMVNSPNEKPSYHYAFSGFGPEAGNFNPLCIQEDFGIYQLNDYTTTAQNRGGKLVSIRYEATPFAPIFILIDKRKSSHSGKEYSVCRIIHTAQPNRDFLFVKGDRKSVV